MLAQDAGAVAAPQTPCPGSAYSYLSRFSLPVAPEGFADDCTFEFGLAAIDVRTGIDHVAVSVGDGIAVDDHGRLASLSPPAAAQFDVMGASGVIASVGDASQRWTLGYGQSGRLTSIAGPSTSVTLAYDAAGHLTGVSSASSSTALGYDGEGRLALYSDSGGDTGSFSYNAAGQLSKAVTGTTAMDPTDVFSYGAGGALLSWTDTNGPSNTLTFTSNGAGDVTQVANGSSTDASLLYTSAHRPMSVQDGAGHTIASFTYDAARRLAQASGPTVTIAFSYDSAGRLAATTRSAQTTGFTYDELGRLAGFTNPGGPTVSLSYLPGPIAVTRPTRQQRRTTARVTGTINPRGAPTEYSFRYGRTARYGQVTALGLVGAASTAISVSAVVSHLKPGTVYHYRLIAANRNAPAHGADLTFKTKPAPPCLVPRLLGETVRQAKRTLQNHGCRLGKVRQPHHVRHGQRLTVTSQHPQAGSIRRPGARVAVSLGAS